MTTSLPEHPAVYARGAMLTGIDTCRPLSTRACRVSRSSGCRFGLNFGRGRDEVYYAMRDLRQGR